MDDPWRDPPAIYRGAPFWSWNGKMTPDRATRQVESMRRAGMGGFFMRSRHGLKTPYLGPEWCDRVSACVEKALADGPNDLIVEVIGNRKNILGPLRAPWIGNTGPNSFEPDRPRWTTQYRLTHHGLMGPVVVETLE